MRSLGGTEIILLLVVVLLLFGAKRLPDAARGLGRSLRILKAETRGLTEENSAPEKGSSTDGDSKQA